MMMTRNFVTLLFFLFFGFCQADSVGKKAADNSPEAEMASFKLHPEFEINLFADEAMGIANPIAMHWDHRGRLWVLTTLTYAQLEPGQSVDDTLVIIEDTDHDGKADKSTVFADGLDMPMGFALGYGGVYLGEGPDLLFLKDTDGDDKADTREVIYTGFGTGDTHQNISNFTWGPDGCLYFAQGLHCFSRIETPWGIVRGDEAGFWRFHPLTLKLQPFCFPSMASQNPCGIVFDRDGAMFVKSNNKELIYVTPGLIPTTHQKNLVPIASIGATPGKSMGAEYVESSHLPDWIQDHILVAGYYSNRVTAFPLVRDGAGFAKVEPVELMVAEHGSFRPVEIKNGPDGAIYIADWFNPIIGHYQASLRHPDRDKKHGRVWRMTAKGRDLNDLSEWPVSEDMIFSDEIVERNLAVELVATKIRGGDKNVVPQLLALASRGAGVEEAGRFSQFSGAEVKDRDLDTILRILAGSDQLDVTRNIRTGLGSVDANLLDLTMNSDDPMVRALTARLIGTFPDKFRVGQSTRTNLGQLPLEFDSSPTQMDQDPRVILEIVVACGNLAQSDSLPFALQALDHPRDRFIDYALEQTVHALATQWVPAAKAGTLKFAKPEHLAYALEIYGGEESREIAKQKLSEADLKPETRARFTRVLAKMGTAEEIRDLFNASEVDAATLQGLIESWATRKLRPALPFAPKLSQLIRSDDQDLRIAAIELAGLWKVAPLGAPLRKVAEDANLPLAVRVGAMKSVSRLQGAKATPFLKNIVEENPDLRLGAVQALALSDAGISAAAELAVEPLADSGKSEWLEPFLNRKLGASILAGALEKMEPPLSSESASTVAMEMGRIGRSDAELMKVLNAARGVQSGAVAYSPDKVSELVSLVEKGGDAVAGKEIFQRAEMTCVACHQVKGIGGVLGPSLDTVGSGLPLDLIVESVIWPDRQLKEGYFAMSVTTKTGETYMGYSEGEREGVLHLRDTASGIVQTIPKGQIAEQKNVGTLMPAGLTNSLSETELRDLVAYLASLKG